MTSCIKEYLCCCFYMKKPDPAEPYRRRAEQTENKTNKVAVAELSFSRVSSSEGYVKSEAVVRDT